MSKVAELVLLRRLRAGLTGYDRVTIERRNNRYDSNEGLREELELMAWSMVYASRVFR